MNYQQSNGITPSTVSPARKAVKSIADQAVKGAALGAVGSRLGRVLGSFKKGGHVKKTGLYKLHKGEDVLPVEKEGKGGSQSAVDRVNARVATDVDDKLNMVGMKKMSACGKALKKMKK